MDGLSLKTGLFILAQDRNGVNGFLRGQLIISVKGDKFPILEPVSGRPFFVDVLILSVSILIHRNGGKGEAFSIVR